MELMDLTKMKCVYFIGFSKLLENSKAISNDFIGNAMNAIKKPLKINAFHKLTP